MNKKRDHYTFPALFLYAQDGITVTFPDLPGCITCGDDQDQAIERATEALGGFLEIMENDDETIPKPSDLRDVQVQDDEAIVLVDAWMVPLREKTVRKNVTIPAKLAFQAERAGINFSRLFTKALEEELKHTA